MSHKDIQDSLTVSVSELLKSLVHILKWLFNLRRKGRLKKAQKLGCEFALLHEWELMF